MLAAPQPQQKCTVAGDAPPSPFQESLAIEPVIRPPPNPGDADHESAKDHRGNQCLADPIALPQQSGHPDTLSQCPLSGIKRTSCFLDCRRKARPHKTVANRVDAPSWE